MMDLAIDVGNTNTVFALCEDKEIKHSWRCETNASRTSDEYAMWLLQLFNLNGYNFDQVKHLIVSSVVPDANFNLQELATHYFKCEAVMVTVETVLPHIKITIDHPHEAGADLLVNAIACAKHYSRDALILDFGTATTLTLITEKEGYFGGVFAPGVNLSLNALVSAAAKLPKISIQKPPHVRGTNTVHAMQSGIFWGYVSMIEGLIEKLSHEVDIKPTVIATGGLASIFSPSIPAIEHVDPDLTLKGLIELV